MPYALEEASANAPLDPKTPRSDLSDPTTPPPVDHIILKDW